MLRYSQLFRCVSIVLLLVCITILSSISSVSAITYSVARIDDNYYQDQYPPRIADNGYVTWYGADGDDEAEIYLFNGSSTTQITNNRDGDYSPEINDNGHVVWGGCITDGPCEVFLYDFATISQVSSNDGGGPQINNTGMIVYSGWDGNDGELFTFDGSTTTRITDNGFSDYNAQINDNGYIAWVGESGEAGFTDIFLFDGTITTQLTDTYDYTNDYSPQTSNNNHVTWWNNNGIFLYDGVTTSQINGTSTSARNPRINNNGWVTWSGYDGGSDYEIFLYDGTSTIQVTNNTIDLEQNPEINDIGWITWQGWDGSDYEIFLYDGAVITQITDNSESDTYPQINNDGLIAWYRGGDIYLASPITPFEVKIKAADGAASDYFGSAVSISGDTAIVGGYQDDDSGSSSGSAYIFKSDGTGNWKQVAKLVANDGAASDYFGFAVSISGDTAIVGAYLDDDNGVDSGSAYIFQDDGNMNWEQIDKLTADDGASSDYFGRAIAISGDTAIIGAYRDDDNGSSSGSAYIFKDDGMGNWTQVDKLTAADGASSDNFGYAVSVSGDAAIIGAYGDDDNGSDSGSAYIFQDDGTGNWEQVDKLIADDGAAADYFAFSVSISGDTVIAGSHYDDDNGDRSGSAYIFKDDGTGNWEQIDKLTAGDGASSDYFGSAVSISGDTAIAGSHYDDDKGSGSGSAYIFQGDGTGNWAQIDKLTADDGASSDFFGSSVSISGDNAIAGSYYDDDNGYNSGSAYVFHLPKVQWSSESRSVPEDSGSVSVTAELVRSIDRDIVIPYTVSGTATGSGGDHDLADGSITITAGMLSSSVTFNLTDDAIDEPDETVVVTMGVTDDVLKGAAAIQTITIQDNDGTCNYTILPLSQSYTASEGTGSVSVTPSGNSCEWTAASNDSWVTITSGSSGTGEGSVGYTVAENSNCIPRSGSMTIAEEIVIIDQDGLVCSCSIAPISESFDASGGSNSIVVTPAHSCCDWTAASDDEWITITSGSSGTGDGTVCFDVDPNCPGNLRSGTMTIAGETFTVNQAGLSCTYSIEPASQSFDASGGSNSIAVTPAYSCCVWTASSSDDWISIESGASGSGSGTVSFNVSANTDCSTRNGTITISGETFTVNQDGLSCTYSIAPVSQSFDASGGSDSIFVTPAYSCCDWTAVSNDGWISINSGASGSGSGTVNYTVSESIECSSRKGTINIAGETFTVNQDPAACTYTINTASKLFDASGGSGWVSVNAAYECCGWTAASNDDWIQIISGSSETGDGSANYSVDANGSSGLRSGTLTIAGETFTVNQDGVTVNWSSASMVVGENAGLISITAELDSMADLDVFVPFTVNGTATGNGLDHDLSAGSITILAGQLYGSTNFSVTDDSIVETGETVVLEMGSPVNAISGLITTMNITILDHSVFQLTDDNYDQKFPKINNDGNVTWQGSDGNDNEIYFYDGNSTTQITINDAEDKNPQINVNGWLAWEGTGIFLYDGTNILQIPDTTTMDWYPQINSHGHLTWEKYLNFEEIYFYDGSSPVRLTSNIITDTHARINDNGYIVWSGNTGSYPPEIHIYDGSATSMITHVNTQDYAPEINNNGWVAWYGRYNSSDTEVYLDDGISIIQLSDNSEDDKYPQINDNGYVAWQGFDGNDDEIFLYDGNSTIQLTDNAFDDNYPKINENGKVVWHGYDGNDWEIFYYDGLAVTRITENDHDDYFPSINDFGFLTWYGHDGNDYEIFLAIPDPYNKPMLKYYPGLIDWNSDLVADFGEGEGLKLYDGNAWNNLTSWGSVNYMGARSTDLIVNFGNDRGIYSSDSVDWTKISGWEDTVHMTVWNDDLVVDFGQGRGIYTYDTAWNKFCGWDTAGRIVAWGTDLVIEFGGGRGTYIYNGSTFTNLCGWENTHHLLTWNDDLVVDFGQGRGIYTNNGSAWTKLCGWDTANKITAWNDKLVIDFGGGRGIYTYDGTWNPISGWDTVHKMTAWGSNLVIDFGGGRGLYTYDGTWQNISGWDDVEEMIVVDQDLIVDYGIGRGVYSYDGSIWTELSSVSTGD